MARGIGLNFWKDVINKFEGKENEYIDYKFCDSLDTLLKADKDKAIQARFDILIENDEQKEPYFRNEMQKEISKHYRWH